MTSIALLGATGNLGLQVARQALARDWRLSVAVRCRSRLASDVAGRATVHDVDLAAARLEDIAAFAGGHDVLVCCAGTVAEGHGFVSLIDRVVSALETLPADRRPVSWFLAGAALLPIDAGGRLGVDLPKVRDTYWPHRANHERLLRSTLDWRLLCPGPMVEGPVLGLQRLRISVESLPAPLGGIARRLPAPLVLPLFALKISEMIVAYADAASVMLAHVERGGPMSKCRIGVALPAGMKGKKDQWVSRPTGERGGAGSASRPLRSQARHINRPASLRCHRWQLRRRSA